MKLWLAILTLSSSINVFAASVPSSIECTAKVTIRKFQVKVDESNGQWVMKVTTDLGSEFGGSVSHSYSPRTETHLFYLPVDHDSALAFETAKNGDMALCLKANECYRCR